MTQEEKIDRINAVLAQLIPESSAWSRHQHPLGDTLTHEQRTFWVSVPSPIRPQEQRISLQLRWDGDIQVEYFHDGQQWPEEALYPLDGREEEGIQASVEFVKDLLEERVVLTGRKPLWALSRDIDAFVAAEELESRKARLNWATSWLGTYDWKRK